MSANPNRLAAEWQGFYRKVLPDGASEIQTQEMRRAFYAGAEAAVMRVLIKSFGPGEDATDQDVRVMQDLADELADFGKAIQEGKA